MNTDKTNKQSEAGNKPAIKGRILTDDELDMVNGGVSTNDVSVYYCNDCKQPFGIPKIMTRSNKMIHCNMCHGQNVEPYDDQNMNP